MPTGWVGEIGKAAKTDDTIAKLLRAQGAILYCKTNIPQSLMVRSIRSRRHSCTEHVLDVGFL